MSINKENYLDLQSNVNGIECLKDIYKLDLKIVLNNVLNKENFSNNFSTVTDILSILEKDSVNSKNDQSIEVHYDRILEFCLDRMHINLSKIDNQHKVSFDSSATTMPIQSELDIILKYLRLCIPRASASMKFVLFKVYLACFIKLISAKHEYINTKDVIEPLKTLNCFSSEEINSFISSNLPVTEYNLKQRNFLTSFFTLVLNESNSFVNDKHGNATIEFLIDYILNVLYGISDNDLSIITMCVNFLSRLAKNLNLRKLVLDKCFLMVRKSSATALNSQECSKTQHFNEHKKSFESFKQDLNLTLLVTLSDLLMENVEIDEKSFLRNFEFWSLIQAGLFNTNVLTRKQALYLLKRTTDMAGSYKKDINSLYFDSYSNKKDSKEKKVVYFYQARNDLWNDFFLCIELLEETSVSDF